MSLESLLKPVKWIDEQLLGEYTKIGGRIPDRHLYKVTSGLHLIGYAGVAMFSPSVGVALYPSMMAFSDGTLNVMGLMGNPPTYVSGDTRVIDPKQEFFLRITRGIRLPLFIAGSSLLGKAAYDTANFFIAGEPIESETYLQAISGLGFISSASSMYLKDQDPKLLDKEPFWKKGYNWIKEKVSSLNPQPTPQPTPIQTETTLDTQLQASA